MNNNTTKMNNQEIIKKTDGIRHTYLTDSEIQPFVIELMNKARLEEKKEIIGKLVKLRGEVTINKEFPSTSMTLISGINEAIKVIDNE